MGKKRKHGARENKIKQFIAECYRSRSIDGRQEKFPESLQMSRNFILVRLQGEVTMSTKNRRKGHCIGHDNENCFSVDAVKMQGRWCKR